MLRLSNPIPVFFDASGKPLDGGKIYVGAAGSDPETSPVDCYWDSALTIPATQPLRTLGGLIVNGTTPANVFIDASDYAIKVADSNGAQIDYSASVYIDTSSFQPRDSDLDAIAALSTTAFGRALLTLADQTALKAAVGYSPFTGGTVTTDVIRQGAGRYAYGASSGMTGMRIFPPLPVGSANPASEPGDIQGFY